MVWLIPISVFWTFAALYLGGLNIEFEGGGGARQVLGLLVTFVVFLLVWSGLRVVLGGIGAVVGGVLLPTALAILSLPVCSRLGFGLFGTRIRKGEAVRH